MPIRVLSNVKRGEQKTSPRLVAIIRDRGWGDVILALGAARAYKAATGARICFMTRPEYLFLAEWAEDVDEALPLTSPPPPDAERIFSLIRAVEVPLESPERRIPRVDLFLMRMGLDPSSIPPEEKVPRISVPEHIRRWAEEVWGEKRPRVAVFPRGRSFQAEKCMASGQLSDLLEGLLRAGAGVAALCDSPLDSVPQGVLDLSGRLPLPLACGIIATSDLVISVDTGAMHMAGALGIKTVALFGDYDDPAIYVRYYPAVEFLQGSRVRDIPVREILGAALRLAGRGEGRIVVYGPGRVCGVGQYGRWLAEALSARYVEFGEEIPASKILLVQYHVAGNCPLEKVREARAERKVFDLHSPAPEEVYRMGDAFVCHSDEVVADAREKGKGKPIYTCPLLPPRREPVVCFHGFCLPAKGIDLILQALAFDPRLSGARAVIHAPIHPQHAEEGEEYLRALQDFIAKHGIGNRVEIIRDFLEKEELERLLGGCDLFCLPYRPEYPEKQSGVVMFLLPFGRPIVATKHPCFRGLDGIEVVSGSWESVAEGIVKAWERATEGGRKAREEALKVYREVLLLRNVDGNA